MSGQSERAFGLIEDGRQNQDLRVRDSDVSVAGGPVRHGVDRSGHRHLLVPLTASQQAAADKSSYGVSLAGRDLLDKGHLDRYQDVMCESFELRDLFAVFSDDLLQRLSIETAPPAAVCTAVLDRWRELFSASRGALLGEGALAGLLAELHVVERIACRDAGNAVAIWTGPDKARSDFMGARAALEVKATTAREMILVEIHGLHQLDHAQLEDLYLYVEQFERVPVGGDNLPGAVERLLEMGVDRAGLLNGLAATGYYASDADAYRHVCFKLVSERTFRVTATGFPKLVPAALADPALADRIFRVYYTIDLTDTTVVPGHIPSLEPAVEHLLAGPPDDPAG